MTTFHDAEASTVDVPPIDMNYVSATHPYESPNLEALTYSYNVGTYTWDTSQSFGHVVGTVQFPEALFSVPYIVQKLHGYQWFRADVEYEVKINATKFHRGALQVSTVPTTYHRLPHLYANSGLSNSVLSASSTTSVSGVIPWFNRDNYLILTDSHLYRSSQMGTLYILVAIPLDAISGASSSVEVTVFANFKNVVLNGPTYRTVQPVSSGPKKARKRIQDAPSGKSVATEAVQKSEEGMLTGISGAVHNLAGKLGSLPIVGEWASAVSAITSITTPLFDSLGLAYPTSVAAPDPSIVKPYTGTVHSSGLDGATMLTMDPQARLADMDLSYREDSLLSIAMTPMLFRTYENNFQTTGSIIESIHAHPKTFGQIGGENELFPTYVSEISSYFKYWRGSLKYRYHFICNSFTSCRIRLSHVTGSPPVGNPENWGGLVPSMVVDIRGDTIVDVTVPYISKQFYTSYENYGYFTSHLVLSVVNKAITPDSASIPTIGVMVYVAAGEDFQWKYPVTPAIQVNLRDDFRRTFNPLIPTNYTPEMGIVGYETITSIRELLSRYYEIDTSVNPRVHPRDWRSDTTFRRVIEMFLGWRGSLRYKWLMIEDANTIRYGVNTVPTPLTFSEGAAIGSVSNASVSMPEFQVPWTYPFVMDLIHTDLGDTNLLGPKMKVGWTGPDAPIWEMIGSAGEDFALYGLIPPRPVEGSGFVKINNNTPTASRNLPPNKRQPQPPRVLLRESTTIQEKPIND